MDKVNVAVTQMVCSKTYETNVNKAERLVRDAAARGANIILLQELFSGPYFCKVQDFTYFSLAQKAAESDLIKRFSALAKELCVVLPISFFERANQAYFNSVAMIDADGTVMGIYRKTHIPQGPGYEEKYYFSPGDTGFKVWNTRFAKVGVGICWDQWFPEAARSMALMGADILLYPTAIGSEPKMPGYDSQPHWQRTMQGHSAANVIPVCASNRIGTEKDQDIEMTFYGTSFITGNTGEILAQCDRKTEDLRIISFNFKEIENMRAGWGLFRDRRPSMYGTLGCLDGQ
ncbi:N-carbamoylputrescine amidase [Desulfobacter postgatei]|jgi:N-carbamoylputrescine amidase|uniref:N-carbamoylputrescine amidase n=1 Tax=Desulfobacter postgatei TaxID=2293 RepID=UPI002A36BB1C|nr:N-carbamoylputrescine amidase [Desulfobacter postgatei]MDX9962178.1 N-carbamoylputrescine amidase [Desulfobacter postgatei]